MLWGFRFSAGLLPAFERFDDNHMSAATRTWRATIDHIDSGPLMLEAAANGLGVAIMHGSHLSDARDPRLTRLFDVEVESPYSYWFVCRPRALKQRAVKIFHDWLLKSGV